MLSIAAASSLSSLAESGAPHPAGTPLATHSTIAPSEDPFLRASSRSTAQRAAAAASGQKNGLRSISPSSKPARAMEYPPSSTRYARMLTLDMNNSATPHADTQAGVSRKAERPTPQY